MCYSGCVHRPLEIKVRQGRIPKLMDIFHDYRPLIPEDSLFDLWDYKVGFLDAKSLWIQLNELVLREEYFFSDDFKAPHRIIDCGSNIGLSLLFFKAVYPNSQVMAFEPEPNCFKVASENLKRNNLEGFANTISAVTTTQTACATLSIYSTIITSTIKSQSRSGSVSNQNIAR